MDYRPWTRFFPCNCKINSSILFLAANEFNLAIRMIRIEHNCFLDKSLTNTCATSQIIYCISYNQIRMYDIFFLPFWIFISPHLSHRSNKTFFIPSSFTMAKHSRLHRHVLNIFWLNILNRCILPFRLYFFYFTSIRFAYFVGVSFFPSNIALYRLLYTCRVHNNSDSLRSFDYKCRMMCWKMKLL